MSVRDVKNRLLSTLFYESILIKIYVNANFVNTQIFHFITYDLNGHERSQNVTFMFFLTLTNVLMDNFLSLVFCQTVNFIRIEAIEEWCQKIKRHQGQLTGWFSSNLYRILKRRNVFGSKLKLFSSEHCNDEKSIHYLNHETYHFKAFHNRVPLRLNCHSNFI